MKIVINTCYGGFSVSEKVFNELGLEWDGYGYLRNSYFGIESDNWDAYRSDPRLIAAVEKIGVEESSNRYSSLKVVEIPDGIEWDLDDYDGIETIHEKHRSWG